MFLISNVDLELSLPLDVLLFIMIAGHMQGDCFCVSAYKIYLVFYFIFEKGLYFSSAE